MSDAITFLGTGGDISVIGRGVRSSGGFVIQVEDNQFHVDPGPGAVANAARYGIKLRANTALFVSHNHLNHAGDINAVIAAMTINGFDKKGVLIANKTLLGKDTEDQTLLHSHFRDQLERYIALEAGQRVGINEIEVRAIKTRHMDTHSIGFKFFTPKYTLVYTSDTEYFPELVEECKNANILILNVLSNHKTKGNLSTDDAAKLLLEVRPSLALVQHFGIDMIKADPLFEVRELQKRTGVQIIAAKDGMVLNPISYAVDQGQRTLYSFPAKQKSLEIKEIRGD